MNKRGSKRKEAMKAYFIIVNLIIASVAFSWMVAAVEPSNYHQIGEVKTTFIYGSEQIEAGTKIFEDTAGKYYTQSAGGSLNLINIADIKNNPDISLISPGSQTYQVSNLQLPSQVGGSVSSGIYPMKLTVDAEKIKGAIINYKDTAGQLQKLPINDPSKISNVILNKDGTATITYDGKVYEGIPKEDASNFIKEGALKKPEGTSGLSKLFGAIKGTAFDALLTGVQWAFGAYMIGQAIGSFAGLDKEQTKALSTALAGGSFTWKFLGTFKEGKIGEKIAGSWFGKHPFISGIVVSGIIFAVMYKKTSVEIVTFTCQPWQAPVGGGDCEKCNKVEGCSDYKCRSLGQACQLLNQGTTDEKCTWVNPKDTSSPVISLWNEVLTKGHKYQPDTAVRPPARGFKILRIGGDECVKAFTPLEFGIVTNEPAQCRIDYNHTLKFDDMAFYFGETNLFLYNHSQKLALPSPASIQAAAPELQHDGTYTLYIRCQDANGNANVDEFAMRFCVEKGPDTTPPKIEGTSIMNKMPVKFNQTSVELEVYVNEPADCKWSREDRSYDNMETSMSCNKNVWEMNNNLVYTCKTLLTGIKDRQENNFYFRCKDQPWLSGTNDSNRNVNMQSYKFTLIGTETLNIIDVKPNGTVKGSTDVVSVWLEIETANGYKNGEALCYYSETQNEKDWIEFFETGTSLHKQRLDLTAGSYKYYLKCVDLGGNRDDNKTEFKVEVDRQAPIIARVYRENELLKIITTEDSECRYSTQSCNFKFEDGIDMPYANSTSHVAEWKIQNYYIRCSDEYGNMPVSNTCSMIVRPYDVVEQKVEE